MNRLGPEAPQALPDPMTRPIPPGQQSIVHFVPEASFSRKGSSLQHGVGKLDVLIVARIPRMGWGRISSSARILLKGRPGTSRSCLEIVTLNFLPNRSEIPLPRANADNKQLDLYYPESQRAGILHLLGHGRRRLMYCWRSSDEAHALSWFISFP